MAKDKDVVDYYVQSYKKFGDSHRAFCWNSRESQQKRFEVLLKVGDLSGKSVLDVGCGTADLSLFLDDHQISCDYFGCDLVPEFIDEARKKTSGDYYQGNFLNIKFNRKFDYIICCGMLNYLGGGYPEAFASLDKMYELATIGIAVNFRSSLHQSMGAQSVFVQSLLSYDPLNVLANCNAKFGKRFLLDHSYLPHDFTLFSYKA
ncbi:MAG: class I SAM-dependent methyltransferase [Bacillota bacterium]